MTPPRKGLKRFFLSLVWRRGGGYPGIIMIFSEVHQGFSQICPILDAQSQVEKQNVFGLSSNDDGILQENIVGCTLWYATTVGSWIFLHCRKDMHVGGVQQAVASEVLWCVTVSWNRIFSIPTVLLLPKGVYQSSFSYWGAP